MTVPNTIEHKVDADGRWLFKLGGGCALFFAAAYLLIIALYIPLGAPPSGAEARLAYMAGKATAWWAILDLSVLTDFLLIPVVLSLYFALRRVNPYAMLIVMVFMAAFILLDLALTWTNTAVLIPLSDRYAAAANDAQRAIYVAAAQYPSMVVESSILFTFNSLTLSIGILIASMVMRNGPFNRRTAVIGMAAGTMGAFAVISSYFTRSLDAMIIFASVLTTVWVFLTGVRLINLAKR